MWFEGSFALTVMEAESVGQFVSGYSYVEPLAPRVQRFQSADI